MSPDFLTHSNSVLRRPFFGSLKALSRAFQGHTEGGENAEIFFALAIGKEINNFRQHNEHQGTFLTTS